MTNKITEQELKEIINKHKQWVAGEGDGIRANLSEIDLSEAYLFRADLSEAYLRKADLRGANLRGANLRGAYLRGADLSGAYLFDTNLSDTNLSDANLSRVDLRKADLCFTNLHQANLYDADLYCADLRDTDLRGANLKGANLYGADLRGTDLSNVTMNWNSHNLIAEKFMRCNGWKKYNVSIACIKGGSEVIGRRTLDWKDYLKILSDKFIAWAIPHIISWITPGDVLPDELEDAILAHYEKQARNQEETA